MTTQYQQQQIDQIKDAAPELLEALKQIAEWAGPPTESEFGTLNKIALIASAAIAKASN